MPPAGLNVRDEPSLEGDVIAVLQHGSFIVTGEETCTDEMNREWVRGESLDDADRVVTGWVAADYLLPHEEGAMDETGRIAPAYEERGFTKHLLEYGESMWSIARENGVDFEEMVELNRRHDIDPNRVFPGDTVYIPGTG